MPNSFFKFKQFTVYHDRCAMKVGTDGVLLGGWTNVNNINNSLDVGTGSGLISLMLVQRNPMMLVDAIDIDKEAVNQAKENVALSPFQTKIDCECISLQNFALNCNKQYDLIVSNPPYFINSLKSPNTERNMARHTDNLPISDLIKLSTNLLNTNGRLSLILPYEYKDMTINLALKNELYTTRITYVYPTPNSEIKRILLEFSKLCSLLEEKELIIETARHIYSDEFRELTKDFYLKM